MNWQAEAERRRETIIDELKQLISIPSVLGEAEEGAPFGKEAKRALDWFLDKGEKNGYRIKNTDGKAGHLETGEGEELLGILCHVDVVPAGSGWTKPPFEGTVEGSRLYGRGAIDDKGPSIAAWTALNMVKDSGAPFSKRVRLIVGTDEESGFRCMDRYFQTEEMPDVGFAPDADFPIINAEKGIAGLVFSQVKTGRGDRLISFRSGERTNMVPDLAEALLEDREDAHRQKFMAFCSQHGARGEILEEGKGIRLIVHGKSAHAMEPDHGTNAGVLLALYLKDILDGDGGEFASFVADHFHGDSRGRALGLDFTDEASGETTFNAGVLRYQRGAPGTVEVSMRYSVTYPFDRKVASYLPGEFTLDIKSNSSPHYVDERDALVKTLQGVYEKQTGKPADLLAIGGGTYARVLDKGVAFGMLFPGEEDVAHQADEYVDIDNLIKATAIYAEAIYELACKKTGKEG